MMITVKVISQSSGNPVEGKRVSLVFGGIFEAGVISENSDSNGEAHFDTKPREGEVHVDGSKKHKGHLSGRVVVYI